LTTLALANAGSPKQVGDKIDFIRVVKGAESLVNGAGSS
jgi:hypothetical protein